MSDVKALINSMRGHPDPRVEEVLDVLGEQDEALGRAGHVWAERDEARCERDAVRAEWAAEKAAKERALYELSLVRTNVENVWRWRNGEENWPESLSCPVVMSPDTLRELLRERDEARATQDKRLTDFAEEMDRQHADCEAKREAAEKERDAALKGSLQRAQDANRAYVENEANEHKRWQERITAVIRDAGLEPIEVTGESGDPLDCTADQVKAALNELLENEAAIKAAIVKLASEWNKYAREALETKL